MRASIIRSAKADDVSAIAAVHVQTWQYAYREILDATFLAQLSLEKRCAMWTTSIMNGHPQILIAQLDDKIVGFVAYGADREFEHMQEAAEIWAFYLLPEAWGSGIGNNLWQMAREQLLARDCKKISLWVMADNLRARAFYEKNGFSLDARRSKQVQIGAQLIEELRYSYLPV